MCRHQFAAGVGPIDLAGLGRTPQDGAEVVMTADPRANTNYRAHASVSSDSDSRERRLMLQDQM